MNPTHSAKDKSKPTAKAASDFGVRAIIAAVLFAYLTALAALPTAGLWSTLPAAAVFAVLASFFCRKRAVIYVLMGVAPFAVICLDGFSLARAFVSGVVCMVMAYLGILAKRAFLTLRKAKRGSDRVVMRKAAVMLAVSVILTAAVWLGFFGNPIGGLLAKAGNQRFVSEAYGDTVCTGYTYYDPFERAYLTQITFDEGEKAETYYVSPKGRDDYYSFCEARLLEDAKIYFEQMTTLSRDSVSCAFADGNLKLTPATSLDAVLERIDYVYEVSLPVPDEAEFDAICENLSPYFYLSDTFVYHSVGVRAQDGSKIYEKCIAQR